MAQRGRIGVLVNNVGGTKTGDPGTMTEEAWDAQIRLNLKDGVPQLQNAVLPVMAQQGSGTVIQQCLDRGLAVAHASAKAAVIHFSQITGVMYANRGLRVNSVSPGMVYTPLLEMLGNSESPEDREIHRKITQHKVPQGSMGDAFDVAHAVVFLASQASRYIIGQNLIVDGGLTGLTGSTGMGHSRL
ncbi:short chain type dehydrogenase [Penicillium capsulatum]|uniref:Short chain type dehydrogenase n=1 Tax=Penicillium capsulatum TaxID=69766 RepID=A0A9W9LFA5_9EURO|nr:short chain type dehydrogenase [Penicillium capsulatum]KAJ6113009.1 short chain type dehydrogenase [Penicillium capsulatum]